METLYNNKLLENWKDVLDDETAGPVIKDRNKRQVMARLLENQKDWNRGSGRGIFKDLNENTGVAEYATLNESVPANYSAGIGGSSTGNITGWDPIVISMLRRAAPQLIAFDVAGVQPLSQPTGLIFSMKSRYTTAGDTDMTNNTEALFDEADTDFSGTGTHAGSDPAVLNDAVPGTYTNGTGVSTATGEAMGDGSTVWAEMGFTVDKLNVAAVTRGLKAEYTYELIQDLRAVHGLDAESELATILSNEILFETNRELIRSIYKTAEIGAQEGTTTAGIFDLDTDSNGRWSVEKFKGLMFQLEREANQIATRTRRGKGNFIIATPDVASALVAAGILDYNPALQAATDMNVDPSTTTFAGVINGRTKVFIDPYISSSVGNNFATVGYKGANAWDAGVFYCPYLALEMYKAVDPDRFQPKVAFKTRYALVSNPYANTSGTAGALQANANRYFRKLKITNLL